MDSDGERASPSPALPPRRQRPGAACEECRARKLKCTGGLKCSVCQEAGVVCQVTTQRSLRGPKKGYLKALRNRVAVLESRLVAQQQQQPEQYLGVEFDDTLPTPPSELSDKVSIEGLQHSTLASSAVFNPETEASTTSSLPDLNSSPTSPVGPTAPAIPKLTVNISELIQAELDQLYFDRVHGSVPILHQRRYLSWAKPRVKETSRICLRHAMWSLATLLSAQFQHFHEPLYQETKRMLESLGLGCNGSSSTDTAQVQAWILIATYESMRAYHRQAWLSAGRAFRLVQMMRLHEIDSPANMLISDPDHTETEERRRVFWMAYFLDHLFSMRNDWPVTLNEHVICTRLPAPEIEFQSGQPVVGTFLSEAIIEASPQILSPFNECVILATICGRSLFHGQQYNIRCAYGELEPDWIEQHHWLDRILATRMRILSQCYPAPTDVCDPMLLFANIMCQATVIYFCQGVESVIGLDPLLFDCQQRALSAAQKIVELAKTLKDFHFSKVHPLTPIPLFLSTDYLYMKQSSHDSFNLCLQALLDILGQLKNVNNHEQNYIHLLESSWASKSMSFAKDIPDSHELGG